MVNTDINDKYHVDWQGRVILDEDEAPIPIYVCICAAHSSYECCCGAWDRPFPEDVDEFRGRDW